MSLGFKRLTSAFHLRLILPRGPFTSGSKWSLHFRFHVVPSLQVPRGPFTSGSKWSLHFRFSNCNSELVIVISRCMLYDLSISCALWWHFICVSVHKLTVYISVLLLASRHANDGTQPAKQSAEIPKTHSSYIAVRLHQHRHQSLQEYTPVRPSTPTFNLILSHKEVYRLVSLLIATLSDAGGASHVIAGDINDVSQGWTIMWLRTPSSVSCRPDAAS